MVELRAVSKAWWGLAVVALAAALIVCRPAGVADCAPQPACAQLRQRVELALTAARRCRGDDACVVESFEYGFRPCGLSVRRGASLSKARDDAKRYQEQCHPVVHPVKCAYLPNAKCERGLCVLAPPGAR
jgi:hypothetical protein